MAAWMRGGWGLRAAIDDLTNISNWKRLILRFFKGAFRACSARTNVPLLCHKDVWIWRNIISIIYWISPTVFSGVVYVISDLCLTHTCKQCLMMFSRLLYFPQVGTTGNQRTLNVKHRLQVWFEMMERNSTFQGSNDYTILNMFHKEAWCIAGTHSGHNTHFYFFTSCSSTKINLCRWTVMTTQDYSDKDVIQDHD